MTEQEYEMLVMYCDAIKHSTKIQLDAIFEDTTVTTHCFGGCHSEYLQINVGANIRGSYKRICVAQKFPIHLFVDQLFYANFFREKFPQRVAQDFCTHAMQEALNG